MKMKINVDRIICILAVGYIILPICLFLIGWTKFYIAVIGCVLLVYFGTRFINDIKETEISITSNGRFWIIALALIAIWTLFSGIGGGAYQTGDFKLRNAVFRDLCTYNYPVIYDMQKEPELVQTLLGNASSGMCVYYFTWWLPAACVARFLSYFHVNSSIAYGAASVSLYLWAVLGLFLTFYCLVRFFNRYSF